MKLAAGMTAFGLWASTIATADTVVLANGDRLSGTLDKMEAGSLWFDTAYAGRLKLPWAQVKRIESDAPVRVRLTDGTELDGRLQVENGESGTGGQIRVRAGDSAKTAPLALARVSAINPPRAPDKTVVNGRASLGGSVTRGNTESETLHLAGEVIARNLAHRVTLEAEASEASQNGARSVSNWRLGMRYDHFMKEKTYLNANTRLDHDGQADLDLRSTLGLGIGRQIVDRQELKLSVEGGLSLVDEDYGSVPDERFPGSRFALNYEQRFRPGGFTLYHGSELLMSLESAADYLYQSKSGLRFPLGGQLSLSTQMNFNYDAVPAAGKKTNDAALIFKLDYSL